MPFFATLAANCARGKGILLPPVGFAYYENITASVNNYNLRTQAIAAGWNGTAILDAVVQVSNGVVIGSTSTATPAFDTGILSANSYLTLLNNGTIVGRGGDGGAGGGSNGVNGGLALNFRSNGIVINSSIIGGGGGGGGGGGSYVLTGVTFFGGSGGGGGAGQLVGAGGVGQNGQFSNGVYGAVGMLMQGGAGGASVSGSGVIISLISGTEFTNSAVYTSSSGASTYWYSITLGGVVTQLGQSATQSYSGRIGVKLFASSQNSANPTVRSNYVGQYFWQDFTNGNSKVTATIPATIPGVDGGSAINTSSFNLVGYLWGGTGQRSNGTVQGGGYTDFAGPITPSSTIWVICGGNGFRTGGQDSSRSPDCRGKSYQGWTDQGGGLSGVFTSDPLDGGNAPLLTAASPAILGIAGGAGGSYSGGTSGGGGGTTGGSGSSSSKNAGGGTQTAGGANVWSNGSSVRDAGFMTGAVVQAGSTTAPGGGGYFGGGGTGGGGESGGGGGGSGYFRTTGGYSGQTIQANNTNPANNGSDYYPGGGVAAGTSGGSDGAGNRGQVRLYLR